MIKTFKVTIYVEDPIDAVEARDDVWDALFEKNLDFRWTGFYVEEVDDKA